MHTYIHCEPGANIPRGTDKFDPLRGHPIVKTSIAHGRARSDIQPSSQIVRQFTAFDATRRSSMSPFTVGQLAGSARLHSHTRGTQIPIAHAAPPTYPLPQF